jgi:hypothetical protein
MCMSCTEHAGWVSGSHSLQDSTRRSKKKSTKKPVSPPAIAPDVPSLAFPSRVDGRPTPSWAKPLPARQEKQTIIASQPAPQETTRERERWSQARGREEDAEHISSCRCRPRTQQCGKKETKELSSTDGSTAPHATMYSMRLCNYATMQLCNYATMQLCSDASKARQDKTGQDKTGPNPPRRRRPPSLPRCHLPQAAPKPGGRLARCFCFAGYRPVSSVRWGCFTSFLGVFDGSAERSRVLSLCTIQYSTLHTSLLYLLPLTGEGYSTAHLHLDRTGCEATPVNTQVPFRRLQDISHAVSGKCTLAPSFLLHDHVL